MSALFEWQKTAQRYAYQGWRSMLVKTFRLAKGQSREYDIIENGDIERVNLGVLGYDVDEEVKEEFQLNTNTGFYS